MQNNKVNFKLINTCTFILIILLLYKNEGLWVKIIKLLSKIFLPFFLSFLFAYAINPIVKFFEKKGISKVISIIIIFLIILIIIFITILLLIPLLFNQSNSLFNEIVVFINHISNKFNIDMSAVQSTLVNYFNTILTDVYKYVTGITINFINIILEYFTLIFIFISSSIYFLIDMDNIRLFIKKILINKKIYDLCKAIDEELKKYYQSFFKIMIITLFEYSICFFIIGHPNYLLLGLLASIASFIPYFGGIAVNIIAAITAFVINTKLFVRTVILFVILSLIDGYVINPIVYGKSNKIPPILTIFAAFAGGILFKILGIIISLPITITILTIYRFFKEDICDKIKKEMKKYKEV